MAAAAKENENIAIHSSL
jgi:hypothetical protein